MKKNESPREYVNWFDKLFHRKKFDQKCLLNLLISEYTDHLNRFVVKNSLRSLFQTKSLAERCFLMVTEDMSDYKKILTVKIIKELEVDASDVERKVIMQIIVTTYQINI